MLRFLSCALLSLIGITPLSEAMAQADLQAAAIDSLAAANSMPSDAKARKIYAKAVKEREEHKYPVAFDDFRKADAEDGGRCVGCEVQAYKTAMQLQDFKGAREQTTLLLQHLTDPAAQATVHYLAGDACLADGGYRIFEKPFQDADGEFLAALQLKPDQADCLYSDGLALAHLHQYDKAKERFQQYMKQASPKDLRYAWAKLFQDRPELARTRMAPNFHLVTSDGKQISMDSLAGKVVLIDFWATWCGPCRNALPHLREITKQFEGQPLVVLSVSVDNDEATWKYFVEKNQMTWAQYRDGSFDGPLARQFAVKAIPTTFTIDAEGFVQDQQVGDGKIEAKLKLLLEHAVETKNGKTVAALQ